MAKIVDELNLAARGGGGFGAPDTSSDLEDMGYEEKLVLEGKVGDMSFLEALGTLKTAEVVDNPDGTQTIKGGVLLLEKSDIPETPFTSRAKIDEIGITGICQRIDSEFVALEIPFKSQAHMSDEARNKPAVEVVISRGKNKGRIRKEKPADMIKIYRISDEFNVDNYAASASKRCQPKVEVVEVVENGVPVKKTVTKPGSTDYNEPTQGQRNRAEVWLEQNGSDISETLEKIGLSFE